MLTEVKKTDLLTGDEITKQLPESVLDNFSRQISRALDNYPLTMVPQTPEDIFNSIVKGRAIFCVKYFDDSYALLSSGILYPERENNLEDSGIRTVEFGSWLAHVQGEGLGMLTLEGARKLSRMTFPDRRLVAVVHVNNTPAQKQIEKAGGRLLSTGPSAYLKIEEGRPAMVKTYDITEKPSVVSGL